MDGRLASIGGPAIPVLMVALVLAQIVATRSSSLLTRRLWLDEYHTLLLAQDPDLGHSMEALKHGADVNVPALYLITRAAIRVAGSADPIVLRGVGLASVLAGLLGLYSSIRRVYPRDVAFIAAMAAWSHPVVIVQAFQARFYGPWFGSVIWLAFALNLRDRSRRKMGPGILVAALAIVVCTIHYFGVFSLVFLAFAHTICAGGTWRAAVARLIPVAAGPLALAAFLPFYFGQKATLSVPTWISSPSVSAVELLIHNIYPFYLFAIPVGVFFGSLLLARGDREVGEDPAREASRLPELAGLAGLAFFPFLLILFSYGVQSVLVDRYFIVTVAAISVLIAPVLARTWRPLRWAAMLGLLAFGLLNLMREARTTGTPDATRVATADLVATLPDAPILFKSRETLYELWWDAPRFRSRYALLSPDDLGDRATDLLRIEADMARNHERWYGMARAATLASVGSAPVFYVVGLDPEDLRTVRADHPDLSFRTIEDGRPIHEVSRVTPAPRGAGPLPSPDL